MQHLFDWTCMHGKSLCETNSVLFDTAGAPRFSQEFKKHSKDWIVRKIYEPTSQAFTTALIEDVLERREKKEASEDQTHFKRPQNIASKPKPPKEDAIKKHQSRFQKDWWTKSSWGNGGHVSYQRNNVNLLVILMMCTYYYFFRKKVVNKKHFQHIVMSQSLLCYYQKRKYLWYYYDEYILLFHLIKKEQENGYEWNSIYFYTL